MINVAIQFLTLLAGLLVNFIIPMLYGLEAYGAFIQANILVFVVQKLTDIVNEPLIGHVDAENVFPVAAWMAVIVWLIFTVTNAFVTLGSPLLLAAMLLSSCVMLGLYSLRWHRVLFAYLVAFLTVFFALLALKELAYWPLTIVDILTWTNLAALPIFYPLALGVRWGGAWVRLRQALRVAPGNISATLVFNLFTNLLPYLLSKTLPLHDLGLFRVMTSVVQSATSLFPVNTKALFVMLRRDADAAQLYPIVLGLSLAYFSGVALAMLALSVFEPRLLPYLALMGGLSALYWAVLSERYLLAVGRKHALVVANLVVGILALALALRVETLGQATMLYAASFAVYALWTLALAGWARYRIAALVVVAMTPIAIYVQSVNLVWAAVWQMGLIIVAFIFFGIRAGDLQRLRTRL